MSKDAKKKVADKIVVRVEESDYRLIESAARANSLPVSTWLRMVGVKAARAVENKEQ